MLSALTALLLAAAQPADPLPATDAPAEPPAAEAPAEPAPAATAPADGFFQPVTKLDGRTLQLVFGERAVIHLDVDGAPVLDGVEKGKLAIAHRLGTVAETFGKPEPGQIAVALDGSAEKKASYLKVWNGLDRPLAYRAGLLVLQQGKLVPVTVKVCAVPAGAVSYETWPRPVVAVALGSFEVTADDKACR
ncbi:MAG: hypothetical protein ABI655_03055 [Phenylobacterium sp.]